MVWSNAPPGGRCQSVSKPIGKWPLTVVFVFGGTPSVSKAEEDGGKSRRKFVKTDGLPIETDGSHRSRSARLCSPTAAGHVGWGQSPFLNGTPSRLAGSCSACGCRRCSHRRGDRPLGPSL